MMSLTKFEIARIIGVRAMQLSNGAKTTINTKLTNVLDIATEEYRLQKIPFVVMRKLPNGVVIKLTTGRVNNKKTEVKEEDEEEEYGEEEDDKDDKEDDEEGDEDEEEEEGDEEEVDDYDEYEVDCDVEEDD